MKQNPKKFTFTSIQKFIFDEFVNNPRLSKKFYFTGGTALSAIYLHHRESEDLDFFSQNEFDSIDIDLFIESISKRLKVKPILIQRERTRIYRLMKGKELTIKIDFAYYPYKRIKRGVNVEGATVDSIQDIATNKLHTITARTEVKDFVDLYFLLKEFSFWDLFYGVKEKFRMELDLIWLAADFLKVRDFKYMPKMLVPLTLEELKQFYEDQAKKIGARISEK